MPQTTQTPGNMLKAVLDKHGITASELSRELHLSRAVISLLLLDRNRISVAMAFRLAKFFNTTPEYWLLAQIRNDIARTGKDKELVSALKDITPLAKKKRK